MVHVTVCFSVEQQRWTHSFQVESGSTILELKAKMLNPPGGKEDLDAFELRRLGRRVPDFEVIDQEPAGLFDFEYLGPGVGAAMAREDERLRGEWQKQLTEGLPPAKRVDRYSNSTTRAVQAVIPSKPKFAPSQSVAPTAALLPPPPPPLPAGDHEVEITIDKELGITATVTVQGGAALSRVKELLAAQDPTGSMRVENFGLALLARGDARVVPLPDTTVLSKEHLLLETTDQQASTATGVAAEEDFPKVQPAARPRGLEQPAPMAPRWSVVGGSDKGGILVREGHKTTSTQLKDRLATGAIVEQVDMVGERLHFHKISGAGPEFGWVSLTVAGKDIVVPKKLSHLDLFTLDRALNMQEEFMEGFSRPGIQQAISRLVKEHPDKGMVFRKKQGELFLSVQAPILQKYGFEGSQKGVFEMMKAYGPYQTPEVAWNSEQLNKLLRM